MGMKMPDFQSATQHAIDRLEHKLSIRYTYHSMWHTCEEVAVMTGRLADMEGADEESRMLMVTGAYFHDVGFTIQRLNHEQVGAEYIHEVLPHYGYTPGQIEIIQGIILATRIPQTPHNKLEEIVDDADLDSLGRIDFWNRSLALRTEMAMLGIYFTDEEWCERQRNFLKQHHYFTDSAKLLREVQKQNNIQFFLTRCSESCPEINWF